MRKYNVHKNKIDKKHIDQLNNIFDVICQNAYAFDSSRKIKAFRKNKNIEISYTENTTPYIKIGKNFTLYLQRN